MLVKIFKIVKMVEMVKIDNIVKDSIFIWNIVHSQHGLNGLASQNGQQLLVLRLSFEFDKNILRGPLYLQNSPIHIFSFLY